MDVEIITSRVERIKNKFLHADELRFVNSQPVSKHLQLLTTLWCAKEAVYKWYGLGEVDFSEMIRLFPFEVNSTGIIEAVFMKADEPEQLTLNYKMIGEIILVWVTSEP